jgi:hypothetical protein
MLSSNELILYPIFEWYQVIGATTKGATTLAATRIGATWPKELRGKGANTKRAKRNFLAK